MPLSFALEKVNDVVVASSLMTRAKYFKLGTGGGLLGSCGPPVYSVYIQHGDFIKGMVSWASCIFHIIFQ